MCVCSSLLGLFSVAVPNLNKAIMMSLMSDYIWQSVEKSNDYYKHTVSKEEFRKDYNV